MIRKLVLSINAKCSDLCYTTLRDQDDGRLLLDRDGYAPSLLPNGGGDFVTLDIDVETGRILNWVVPTEEQMINFIAGRDVDEDEIKKPVFDAKAFDEAHSKPNDEVFLWLCNDCGQMDDVLTATSQSKKDFCECCENLRLLRLYEAI